jgi:hypothetical protein
MGEGYLFYSVLKDGAMVHIGFIFCGNNVTRNVKFLNNVTCDVVF